MLALAPSEGPLYRGRLLRALAAFAVPAGIAIGVASLLSFFLVDGVFGGTLSEGRTAATTTLIVLGLCFILLLERGPGREHITIQSYMLAMVAGLGALFALILAAAPVREFFELELLVGRPVVPGAGLASRSGSCSRGARLAAALHPAARGCRRGRRARADDGPGPTHTPRTSELDAAGEAAERRSHGRRAATQRP